MSEDACRQPYKYAMSLNRQGGGIRRVTVHVLVRILQKRASTAFFSCRQSILAGATATNRDIGTNQAANGRKRTINSYMRRNTGCSCPGQGRRASIMLLHSVRGAVVLLTSSLARIALVARLR